VSPSLEGEIRLSTEADTEDDNGEEAGDVAGQFPVLPLPRLARWWRGSVQEVAVRPLLVTWARPSVSASAASTEALDET